MNTVRTATRLLVLGLRLLLARPLAAALNLGLLTLGLAAICFVMLVAHQVDQAFERDLTGIDLVVGAKGSPIQLILTGVFHIDAPTGNIALSEVQALARDPRVGQLMPLSLGDSFQGFRIVGSTPDYIRHYGATLAQGQVWSGPMQAVLGAKVAAATGIGTGAHFAGAHGLGGGGRGHVDTPYSVSGVLQPCGCVLDRLVLTATESVWEVHEHAGSAAEPAREVTLALIRYSSPLAAASLPRFVNSSTAMQAAAPALEISRLLRLVGVGTDVLRGFGAVLLLTAGLSVFIALWSAVHERRHDLAMLRMLGASPAMVAGLVLCQALWLALVASALGLLGGHLLAALVGYALEQQKSITLGGWIWVPGELWIVAVALLVAGLAAMLPSWSAYRVDVAQLLNAR